MDGAAPERRLAAFRDAAEPALVADIPDINDQVGAFDATEQRRPRLTLAPLVRSARGHDVQVPVRSGE